MPNPDLLPRGRSFADEPAPSLDGILAAARRRQRARAGVLGAVVTAAAAISGVVILTSGATTNSLKVVTPAVSTAPTAAPTPSPSESGIIIDYGPSAVALPSASAPGVAASSSPGGGGSAAPTPTPSPHDSAPGIVGPSSRMTPYDASRGCSGSGPTAATGWCSYYTGATSGRGGHAVVLSTAVCRLPSQSTGTLTSDTGKQADFDAGVKTYPASWDWAYGRHFSSAPTTITVPAGSCVEWYVTWDVTDNAGHALAPGSYYLDADPLAGPSGDSASAWNPVTFTVN